MKDNSFCRLHAEITDVHYTKIHRFEAVGLFRASPYTPKKNFPVLIADPELPEFGQMFRLRKYRDRSMRMAQVVDHSNELREYRVSQLTLAEEIKQ